MKLLSEISIIRFFLFFYFLINNRKKSKIFCTIQLYLLNRIPIPESTLKANSER